MENQSTRILATLQTFMWKSQFSSMFSARGLLQMGESIASWRIIGVHFQNNESKNCYVQQNEPRMVLYMSSISLHSFTMGETLNFVIWKKIASRYLVESLQILIVGTFEIMHTKKDLSV